MTNPSDAPAADRPNAEPATRVRYVIVFAAFLAAVLLYLHRFCMSYAQRYIKEDLGLTDQDLAFCFSAFFLAYALAQVPSGWLSDRIGARSTLTAFILTWSFFTGMMGLTVGFFMLFAVRVAAGLGQAGAYPTCAGLLGKWIPLSARGTASSIVAFGGRLGGGIAPILTAALIVAFVPVEQSSQLVSDDLMDAYRLCFRLRQPVNITAETDQPIQEELLQVPPPIERLANKLPTAAQAVADQLYQTYQHAAVDQQRSGSKQRTPDVNENSLASAAYSTELAATLPTVTLKQTQVLVDGLNELLHDPSLYDRQVFADLRLERQAERLAQRERATLSSDELQRLNRLLLEAVFPDSIRKIYVHGWRPVMFVYGALGIFVAGFFWWQFRNSPAEHSRCNAAEVAWIQAGNAAHHKHTDSRGARFPGRQILTSRSLWLMCVTQWGSNVGWVFLVTWLPSYLLSVHKLPLEERGLMAAAPLFVGWAGMLLGGRLTDSMTSRMGLRWGRVIPLAAGRFLAMAAYLTCLLHPSPWSVTVAFACVAFGTDMGSASIWAYKQDVGGRYVASIHGWANMWGNLGATVSPILLRSVVGADNNWDAAFLTCAAAYFIAGIAALGIDARIPIDDVNTTKSDKRARSASK